jgi:arginine decarboxylase
MTAHRLKDWQSFFYAENLFTFKIEKNPVINNKQVYAIKQWGEGYFDINEQGHVTACPQKQETQHPIDLYELAKKLQDQGLELPVLVRFSDILQDRVRHLNRAFATAQTNHHYQGGYTAIYPIKVNQQYDVLEGITQQNVGLEAGSKPELLAILAFPNKFVVCNGYKDRAYMRIALIGSQISQLFIVIEKKSELDLLLQEAKALGIRPKIGVRIRLSSMSSGRWQNSGGSKSKFGFSAVKVLEFISHLTETGYLDCLTLLHFHIGSQVANLHDIKTAMKEAARHYVELQQLGAPIQYMDVGGGLGVDYEGTASRSHFSMNYSLDEYADTIVKTLAEICDKYQLPQPHLFTESGRAMTAHHCVLITNVVEVEQVPTPETPQSSITDNSVSEAYHDAKFNLAQIHHDYLHGQISLTQLAKAEQEFTEISLQIRSKLDVNVRAHREILDTLNELLADKIFCNFSLFQSLPDTWALAQIFPIMPLQRLNEPANHRVIIQDITCDSDGRISSYLDSQSIEKTLPLHAIAKNEMYYMGFFMVGAYQEILSDLHNLFGDVNCANIKLDAAGNYAISNVIQGDNAIDLLKYVDISADFLIQAYQEKLAVFAPEKRLAYSEELQLALNSYTYLQVTHHHS